MSPLYDLDVTDAGQINRLAMAFEGRELDVLIHSAGVMGTGMDRDLVLTINAEAPFQVISALMPAVERSREKKKITILTSHMGARNGGPDPDQYLWRVEGRSERSLP